MSQPLRKEKVEFKKNKCSFGLTRNRYWSDIMRGQGGEAEERFDYLNFGIWSKIVTYGYKKSGSPIFIDAGYWEKNFDSVKSSVAQCGGICVQEDGEVLQDSQYGYGLH